MRARHRAASIVMSLVVAAGMATIPATTAKAFTAPIGNGYWDECKVKRIATYYTQTDFNHPIATVYASVGVTARISAGRSGLHPGP